MHEVVDAGEQDPLPAAQAADLGMDEGTRDPTRGLHGTRRPLDDPLALGDLAEQGRAIDVRCAGDPLDDAWGVVRPSASRGERRGQA